MRFIVDLLFTSSKCWATLAALGKPLPDGRGSEPHNSFRAATVRERSFGQVPSDRATNENCKIDKVPQAFLPVLVLIFLGLLRPVYESPPACRCNAGLRFKLRINR